MLQDRSRTVRNIVVFAAVAAGIGWLGAGLNRLLNLKPDQNLGMLLWLIFPLAAVLFLRALGGDGWKDAGLWPAFRGNGGAYALSLLAYPVVIALVLGAGALAGAISFPRPDGSAFLSLAAAAFAANFFKNILEEFCWRGYLTPRLEAAGLSAFANHLVTAAVWGAWHLPYWFLLIDAEHLSAHLQTLVADVAGIMGADDIRNLLASVFSKRPCRR